MLNHRVWLYKRVRFFIQAGVLETILEEMSNFSHR